MSQSDPTISSAECTLETIVAFIVPFFLAGAGGDLQIAKKAVRELIDAYNPVSATEIDLAGRIVAFSIAGMDNLRLSMAPDLSDTKVLRYRCNAITLIRSSDQARKRLATMREKGEQPHKIPRPSIVPATAPVARATTRVEAPAIQPQPAKTPASGQAAPVSNAAAPKSPPGDFEAMKRDARILMQVFSKSGGSSPVSMPTIPDPSAAAAAAAIGNLRRA